MTEQEVIEAIESLKSGDLSSEEELEVLEKLLEDKRKKLGIIQPNAGRSF